MTYKKSHFSHVEKEDGNIYHTWLLNHSSYSTNIAKYIFKPSASNKSRGNFILWCIREDRPHHFNLVLRSNSLCNWIFFLEFQGSSLLVCYMVPPPALALPLRSCLWALSFCLRKGLFEPFVEIAFASVSRDPPFLIPRLSACSSFPSEYWPGTFFWCRWTLAGQLGISRQWRLPHVQSTQTLWLQFAIGSWGNCNKNVSDWLNTAGALDWRAGESSVWSNTVRCFPARGGKVIYLSCSLSSIPCSGLWQALSVALCRKWQLLNNIRREEKSQGFLSRSRFWKLCTWYD